MINGKRLHGIDLPYEARRQVCSCQARLVGRQLRTGSVYKSVLRL